jgi:hypothetical protein
LRFIYNLVYAVYACERISYAIFSWTSPAQFGEISHILGANLCRLAKPSVPQEEELDPELLMLSYEKPESFEDAERKDIRRGIDLATTLERIAKNFVITDPRLPDNPIVKFTYFTENHHSCDLE